MSYVCIFILPTDFTWLELKILHTSQSLKKFSKFAVQYQLAKFYDLFSHQFIELLALLVKILLGNVLVASVISLASQWQSWLLQINVDLTLCQTKQLLYLTLKDLNLTHAYWWACDVCNLYTNQYEYVCHITVTQSDLILENALRTAQGWRQLRKVLKITRR